MNSVIKPLGSLPPKLSRISLLEIFNITTCSVIGEKQKLSINLFTFMPMASRLFRLSRLLALAPHNFPPLSHHMCEQDIRA